MGKLSPISIKYVIKIKFEADGTVEKPDVIGAIFGQTEGLLGEDLELRELQKKGKIGRIEVEIQQVNDKVTGIIEIPSALDKTETTLIAAAIETIDRIGPTLAKFNVIEVEDVREEKRKYIIERAKELLKKISEQIPETKEIEEAVKLKLKVSDIKEIGKEKLPAGNIEGNEIIVVEGRADVVNLIKYGVDNVIAMNGMKVTSGLKKIIKDKEVTLFIDGDRGGLLLAKNFLKSKARVDYIARAPDGKEVEELTAKEIYNALRKRKPVLEFFEEIKKPEENKEIYKKIKPFLDEIKNTNKAYIVDSNFRLRKIFSITNLKKILRDEVERGYCLIIDGSVDDYILDLAESKGYKIVVARNFLIKKSHKINLLSF
ncbi:MAG: DNA primase DnaG [Candidatus Pacearchaeota archaeon]